MNIQAQPVEYDEQVWPSIRALARAHNVCDGSVHKALVRGHWHGKPIRRVGREESPSGLTDAAKHEDEKIRALLSTCRGGTSPQMSLRGRW